MSRPASTSTIRLADRDALRRKVKKMYDSFNRGLWEKCFAFVDPKLRQGSRTTLPLYSENLRAFKEAYGTIKTWHIRISLHLDGSSNKADRRAFAYVYVVWQDAAHEFHMFKERWVKDSGLWYSRVLGLVPNRDT